MQYRTDARIPARATAVRRRSSQPAPITKDVYEDDEYYTPRVQTEDDLYRMPTTRSVVRTQPRKVIRTQVRTEEPDPTLRQVHRFGIRMVIGSTFIIATLSVVFVVGVVFPAFNNWHDDQTYGYPRRTAVIEANVGHGTATAPNSAFIGMNINGDIRVMELSEDPTKIAQSYTYEIADVAGPGASKVPITNISFYDRNGDGKVDMVVTVDGTVYTEYNDGTKFSGQPKQPSS